MTFMGLVAVVLILSNDKLVINNNKAPGVPTIASSLNTIYNIGVTKKEVSIISARHILFTIFKNPAQCFFMCHFL